MPNGCLFNRNLDIYFIAAVGKKQRIVIVSAREGDRAKETLVRAQIRLLFSFISFSV